MSDGYDWPTIQQLRLQGKTWEEVASAVVGTFAGSADRLRAAARIRKAYSRFVASYEEAVQGEGMRILGLDIETAPHTAYVWGFYQQFIDPKNVDRTGRVMCYAARWYSHPTAAVEFRSEFADGHEETIRAAHALLDEADAVVHYNGTKFDIPTLHAEFLRYGLTPPAPTAEIDLLKVMKKRFRFSSNKLDYVLRELGLGQKVDHRGFQLWVQCMAGDAEAWAEMEKYNRADVTEMEKLYKALLPWISNHPNHALYQKTDGPTCPNCGGRHLNSKGYARTKTQEYKRYVCMDCGTYTRERYTGVDKDKRKHILTQAI